MKLQKGKKLSHNKLCKVFNFCGFQRFNIGKTQAAEINKNNETIRSK